MLSTKTLILDSHDINTIVDKMGIDQIMDDLIFRLRSAFENYEKEETDIPIRSGFHYDRPSSGLVEWMPIHQKGDQIVIKVVGYHPDNPALYDLPTIISTISSYDTRTGHLKSVTEGVFLTALRTGAASAIASTYLARPESKMLGLIGCGAQAVTQLHALSRVFKLSEVIYHDSDLATMQSFTDRVQCLGIDLKFTSASVEEIVRKADILSTATSISVGEGPLFKNIVPKPWLHINAVGSDFPGKTELPIDLLRASKVCPDFLDQAVREGECQQLKDKDISNDLFQIAKRPDDFEHYKLLTTVFDSTGLALEDQVVNDLFIDYAIQLKVGNFIDLEMIPKDAKNPYEMVSLRRNQKSTKRA